MLTLQGSWLDERVSDFFDWELVCAAIEVTFEWMFEQYILVNLQHALMGDWTWRQYRLSWSNVRVLRYLSIIDACILGHYLTKTAVWLVVKGHEVYSHYHLQ